MQEEIKIPKERVAVLIGDKGKTKKQIEKLTSVKLKISSKEGDVFIDGKDSLEVYVVKEVIHAIGRGFNPKKALNLLDDKNIMEIINVHEFSGRSKKQEIRIKSRVIGTEGKARVNFEKATNTSICVYGKTVCIIGTYENVELAKGALEKLIKGAPHGKVYSWIERQKLENL
jgi:ribosomal RNA assembly protein